MRNEVTDVYLGLSLEEAQSRADETGYTVRIVQIDGVPQGVTEDAQAFRVNVVLEGDTVVDAFIT